MAAHGVCFPLGQSLITVVEHSNETVFCRFRADNIERVMHLFYVVVVEQWYASEWI